MEYSYRAIEGLMPTELVSDFLFLGSNESARNKKQLDALQIGCILNMADELENAFPDSFQYKKCGVNDTIEGSHFRQFFDGAMQFMDDARRDGKRLYVHCAMGISRSPAICIAWLMKEHRWDYATAQAFVKSQRRCICPNPGFVKFLKEYEKDIVTQ
eukprot:TRINITY_DN367_c0_g1_i2.p1 TRINITY_DN367_c0_g1~~TRINITY_DN367_c0_g1_i2.p1  ORF type:complete len:157 (+),score=35.92 TRINITY_DN367_c0_g1_i2:534-1004(+)